MKKWLTKKNTGIMLLTFLLILIIIPSITATDIQVSTDNSTWTNCLGCIVNEANKTAYIVGLDKETTYYFRVKNDSTDWSYTSKTTEDADVMITGIAIMMFVMLSVFIYMGWVFYKDYSWLHYMCYLFWYLALLVPLIGLRIAGELDNLNTNIKTIINDAFSVYLIVYLFLLLMLFVIVMYQMFLYLMPDKSPLWQQNRGKK